MRNNREKWEFFKSPLRPTLTTEEVMYYRRSLVQTLKAGVEIELNMPNRTSGKCNGSNIVCACKQVFTDTCWLVCANREACMSKRSPSTCEFINVCKECKDFGKEHTDCEKYKFKCSNMTCVNFVSACFSCGLFETDCKNCPDRFDEKGDPEYLRGCITKELKPSHNYGNVGPFGVHSIVTDGSLLGAGGVEIITNGRRVNFWEFYKMFSKILKVATKHGAWTNERCSIHVHLLASYYANVSKQLGNKSIPNNIQELERSIPEIVLANFHQLVRRYQNALTWMTMGLSDPDHFRRWEKFSVSVLDFSAIPMTMENVSNDISQACRTETSGGSKYSFVNYLLSHFDDNGDVSRLHVEMRQSDGMMCPSILAALPCLYYALIIKATEISRHGLLKIGDETWLDRAKKIKKAILNNRSSWGDAKGPHGRLSDTKNLYKYYDILTSESLEMIHQVKHILSTVGPAYEILVSLAERPVALRRHDGESWQGIEDSIAVPMNESTLLETSIDELVSLRIVTECKNIGEWKVEIIHELQREYDDMSIEGLDGSLTNYVEDGFGDGKFLWSRSLGTVMATF